MELPTYTKTYHDDVYPAISATRPELSAKGKRVVITGAAAGIGAATAESFAEAGAAEVIILGRNTSTLEATAASIRSKHAGANIVPLAVQLTESASVASTFATIAKRGPIDVYISNAGYLSDIGLVDASDPVEWWKSWEVNVRGAFEAVQAVLKNIRPDGVIINVSTAMVHIPPLPRSSAYAAGKLGAAKLFEYIQKEYPELNVYNLQPAVSGATGMGTKAVQQFGFDFGKQDTLQLPSNFMVWLASPEATFLKGRFLYANWDVDELKARKQEYEEHPELLTLGLLGWS